MQLRKGMMLEFIKLGQGLIVGISKTYESSIGKHPYAAMTDDRVILTNKYEADVLCEGTIYPMNIVIHFEWEGDLCRVEWRVVRPQRIGPSGLAEFLWQEAP